MYACQPGPPRSLDPLQRLGRPGALPLVAQIRIPGNSFGNKGCSVILSFRKYPRKYAYPGQKVALAPGEISGQGGRKVRCGRVCKASLEATQLAPRGPAGIAVQARAERMAPQSVQQYCGQRSAVSSQSSISAVTSLLSPVMCQVVRSRVSDSATHGVEQRDGPVEGAQAEVERGRAGRGEGQQQTTMHCRSQWSRSGLSECNHVAVDGHHLMPV